MDAKRLEKQTRNAVLSVAALAVTALGVNAYRASNLCLADGSWKTSDYYKLVALKRIEPGDLERSALIDAARRVENDAKLRVLLAADPSAVVLGKKGYSEWDGATFTDWLSGAKSKVVSIKAGVSTGGMNTYRYVQLDNCGCL